MSQDDHGDADQDHRQRQPLPHADRVGLPENAVIRLAEKFGDEAECAVADQEYAGYRCPWSDLPAKKSHRMANSARPSSPT